MLKNLLLASAAALVVLGAAASLTNMKAVITSGNQAEAALTRDGFDLTAQINEFRQEQTRQATLLSVQEVAMRRLQDDIVRSKFATAGSPMAAMLFEEAYSIGLDIPSPEREQKAVDYHIAWLQALNLDTELMQAEMRYDELEQTSVSRIAELESASVKQMAALEVETTARFAEFEKSTRFEIARLQEEIAQRDSSIVGLMHRLVSVQSSSAAPQPQSMAKSTKRDAPVEQRADRMPKSALPQVENREVATVTVTDNRSTPLQVRSVTVGDGVAAYQNGNFSEAFDIWRPLADAGDARAYFYLGALYYEGRGVERELKTAYLMLNKAVEAGHARAARLRDRVASEMKDAQFAAVPGAAPR